LVSSSFWFFLCHFDFSFFPSFFSCRLVTQALVTVLDQPIFALAYECCVTPLFANSKVPSWRRWRFNQGAADGEPK
jgi:hypothetical protein